MLAPLTLRCLIVDDSPDFISWACESLERQGATVVGHASSGAEAIALANTVEADVALVDVGLGDENGLDVAGALVAAEAHLRVIMISAYAEADLQDLLVDSPALGFVDKPRLSREAIERLLSANPGT
jgi:CheY-like chemotaxis protein